MPQIHGAARDALGFTERQLEVELNAHQGNPLIVPDEARLVSVGNFDSQALATALDLARLALAPVITAAVERTLKLLSPRFSGLTEGLVAAEGSWQDGLSELGVAAQAITAEARLLAQPVSLELASTMQESGVEDRTSLSSLGCAPARRDARTRRADRRDRAHGVRAGRRPPRPASCSVRGAVAIHDYVRERVGFLDAPERMPLPLEELATDDPSESTARMTTITTCISTSGRSPSSARFARTTRSRSSTAASSRRKRAASRSISWK